MKRHLASILTVGLLAGTACSELTTAELRELAPEVNIVEANVLAGSPVVLRLVNESPFQWAYRHCPARFETKVDGEWQDVGEPFMVCTLDLRNIGARQTLEMVWIMHSSPAPGEYRAVVEFEKDGTVADRRSNSFNVIVTAEVACTECGRLAR